MHDIFLPMPYSSENVVQGKQAAKDQLRHSLGLRNSEAPILAIVSRLTQQKGVDLMEHAIRIGLERGCQVALLGSAFDPDMQQHWEMFADEIRQFQHDNARFVLSYDEPLSHLIYAGADMLLVPSMFEPCGLSQLIAMRYGTIPIVRRTGGLNDTIYDFDHDKAKATHDMLQCNGFSFDGADYEGIEYAVHRAIDAFYNDRNWWYGTAARGVMEQDWTWARPALDYMSIYRSARK